MTHFSTLIRGLFLWILILRAEGAITWNTPSGGHGATKQLENIPASTIIETMSAATTGRTSGGATAAIVAYLAVNQSVPGTFVVDNGGQVRLSPGKHLDFESVTSHRLVVTATDNSATPMTSTATLTISVLDVNDNTPVFSQPVYNAKVSSTAVNGTIVDTVAATDADGTAANNGIGFKFLLGDPHFTIGAKSGAITTTGVAFSKSVKSQFELSVVAVDSGTPHKVGTAKVRICLDAVCPPVTTPGTPARSGSSTISPCPCRCSGASVLSGSFALLSALLAGIVWRFLL